MNEYFTAGEFACKCCGVEIMDIAFIERLTAARKLAGVPFVITSGYRCLNHNIAVGSASMNHPQGKAADIACTTGAERILIVKSLLDAGFMRIGIGQNFIHADSRSILSAMWIY